MILLDSSIFIELFRKTDKNKTTFVRLSEKYNDFSISSISHYEVGIGNRKIHIDYWNSLLKHITILPFDQKSSQFAIEIYQNLIKKNKLIDIADIMIGATALANSLPIATLNIKHFARIDSLEIIQNEN